MGSRLSNVVVLLSAACVKDDADADDVAMAIFGDAFEQVDPR